ncbi:hemicentin-1-like [Anopheles darlingi]|uniref:hemicentin-1-like n=1 Tax=Anopheles darlingi TaxID=43151 RepID=UPI0021003E8B|nr:hemicentin-1-like [Anopheles darlingi]
MTQAASARPTHRKCKCNTMNANLPLIAAFINFIVICFADSLSPEMQMYWENHMVQPYFDNTTKREVTAIAGQTCQLHCRVKSLGDRAVSWIRKRDLHILTVGILTYTNDQRFQSLHTDGSDEWTLRITSPQARDSGVYECQVSTEPKISQAFRVNVVVSKANILGNAELFVKSGSDINLTCVALQSPQPPSFIYWYKGGRVINYSQRGGISVLTEQQTRTSRLLIARASPSDSGNYTCAPSNSDSASVVVHVIKGEHPAAMQHGINGASMTRSSAYTVVAIVSACVQLCLLATHALAAEVSASPVAGPVR